MTQAGLDLKIMLLNAENLFLLSDQQLTIEHTALEEQKWQKLSTSIYDNKPLYKLRQLTKVIADENPDIIMLAEVGGFESLSNFNKLFLQENYSCVLTEGNSNRHIDIGYLVKKNLGFYFDLISNKNRPINYLYPHERESLDKETNTGSKLSSHKFSRDVSELHLFKNDREKPFLVFMLAHLKSRLDPDNVDPNGSERRNAEARTLIEIYNELESKHQNRIPIVVAGDFNGNASAKNTDPEFTQLYQNTKLSDVLEIAQIPQENRYTYYQVGRNSNGDGRQIDFVFLSPKAAQFLDSKTVNVYRYKDPRGLPMDPPSSMDAKLQLPSDHYPIILQLKNIQI